MNVNFGLSNEMGAALLLTLFIIVFVSIVGAGLLNTTFYGKQNNVKALREQVEFYKLEAALDLLLHEMATFSIEDGVLMYHDGENILYPVIDDEGNEIPLIKSGPYYYIETGQPLDVTYEIDGQEIQVIITYEPNNIEGFNQYSYNLVALFPDGQFERSLELTVSVPNQDEFIQIPPTPPGDACKRRIC